MTKFKVGDRVVDQRGREGVIVGEKYIFEYMFLVKDDKGYEFSRDDRELKLCPPPTPLSTG
jgi:hypothetical protein